jgi:hypothetical protein
VTQLALLTTTGAPAVRYDEVSECCWRTVIRCQHGRCGQANGLALRHGRFLCAVHRYDPPREAPT